MPKVISLNQEFKKLKFLPNRKPNISPEEVSESFSTLDNYQEGGIFIGHYAGESEWERHSVGDEIVMAVEGRTTLVMLVNNQEQEYHLNSGELIVVPQNTWHRFITKNEVKIMTVTPQPTDHSIEFPE